MDEPLSNLDAKLRVQMRADIAKLQHDLGDDDDLRHPRPGRGDDDGRPRRRDEPRRAAAGRHAAAALRRAGEPVRRRLHRHAADEPARGATCTPRTATVALRSAASALELADEALARYPRAARPTTAARSSSACAASDLHPAATRPDLPTMTARARPARGARLATRSRTSRSTREAVTQARGDVEEEERGRRASEGVTASRPNLVAAVPGARRARAEARRPDPVAVDVAQRCTSSTRRLVRRCASAARRRGRSRRALGASRLRRRASNGRSRRRRPAPRCAALSQPPATRRDRVAADLLRHDRPLRERRPVERHGRPQRRPRDDRLRPGRRRLVPRRRLQGPDRRLHRHRCTGSRGSRTSASTRSGSTPPFGQQRRAGRQRRLPRLLGHRLHARRPAPRHRRRLRRVRRLRAPRSG